MRGRPGTGPEGAAESARRDANRCFVCGPANPIGLHLEFWLDDEVCRAEFTPGRDHEGYPGMTHGGILYSALDDVMANWLHLRGIRGHTARCEVRYREPLPIGTPVRLEGWMTRRRGRLVLLEGRAVRAGDGAVVAESSASFMVVERGES